MDLSPEDVAALQAHLRKYDGKAKPQCPVCSTNNWNPGGRVVLPGGTPTGGVSLGFVFQAIALVCSECGYMKLFAAKAIVPTRTNG